MHAESAPISERGLLKLFEQYAQISKGNIGVTMLRWLASIERFENDKIYISPKRDFKLPSLLPNHWANLLTQVVLHQVMHRDTIYQIFRMQDRKVVAKVIKDLVLTGLLVEISKNTYSIDQFVVKSVLEQLQSEKYLNTYE